MTPGADAFTLETFAAGDGYRWRYRRYPAKGVGRARVVALHGIQSHGGWYTHSCRQLAAAGYGVAFLDRRGSGLNERDRGDTPGFRRLLDDIAEFLRAERAGGAADRPLFLLAISWGGKLGVALQKRHPGLVDGLALLGPGLCPRIRPTFRQRLAVLWARLTSPRRLFPVPLDDPALFTANPRWQQFLRDDPLALRRVTARFLVENARLDGYLRFAYRRVRVPVLLLLGEHDRIIDNARTRRVVNRFPTADRDAIEYAGAHHTLEFEPDPDRHVADLLRWLDRQTGKARRLLDNPPAAT